MHKFEHSIDLHPAQMEIFKDNHFGRVLSCGRRFGKSRVVIVDSLISTLMFKGDVDLLSPELVVVGAPLLKQARKVFWTPLVNMCEKTNLSKFVKDIKKADLEIHFYNKPALVLTGVNEGNRGGRFYRFYGDEWQDAKPKIFDSVIIPALADTRDSRFMLSGTPKGKFHHFHEVYSRSEQHPDRYRSFNYPSGANPSKQLHREIDAARLIMPPSLFNQEFLGEFVDFEGKFYTELDEDNLVNKLPATFDFTVMGVDWGDTNPALVVYGYSDKRWYFLEGYQGDGRMPVPEPILKLQARRLCQQYNVDRSFCDPSRPTSILSFREEGRTYKIRGLERCVAGVNSITEGINDVHCLIYQKSLLFLRHDTPRNPTHITGQLAYELFNSYHRKIIDGHFTELVEPHQNDHCLDASRYIFASLKN